jgi:drug/metabolite transporter (DMT)-like permease
VTVADAADHGPAGAGDGQTAATAGLDRLLPLTLRPWLGAVMISFSAVWVRFADVEPARSAMLRATYALPVLLVLVLVRARRHGPPDGPGAGWRTWLLPGAVGAGILLGIDFVAWHESIAIIGAGLGTVLPNLQVVFVGIAGVVLFRERPAGSFWAALPIVLVGIWLLGAVGRPIVDGASVALGVVYGLIAAITYAGCLVWLRMARARTTSAAAVTVLLSLTVGSLLVTGPVAAYEGVAGPAGWPADGWLIVLALGSQVVGWLLLTSSIHVLPAAATSVALLLQPVLALGWGALLLAEPLGVAQLTGAAVVLLGVALAHHGARQVRVTVTTTAGPSRLARDR